MKNLGFRIARSVGTPTFAQWIADGSGQVMIEIYNNPKVGVPDYSVVDPLILHLALVSDDVAADRARLIAAGAAALDEVTVTDAGDELAMLRDPRGFPLQLARRAAPMI